MIEIKLVTGKVHIFHPLTKADQGKYPGPLEMWIDKIHSVQGYVANPEIDPPKSMISLTRNDWVCRMADNHKDDCEATANDFAKISGIFFKPQPPQKAKEKKPHHQKVKPDTEQGDTDTEQ